MMTGEDDMPLHSMWHYIVDAKNQIIHSWDARRKLSRADLALLRRELAARQLKRVCDVHARALVQRGSRPRARVARARRATTVGRASASDGDGAAGGVEESTPAAEQPSAEHAREAMHALLRRPTHDLLDLVRRYVDAHQLERDVASLELRLGLSLVYRELARRGVAAPKPMKRRSKS